MLDTLFRSAGVPCKTRWLRSKKMTRYTNRVIENFIQVKEYYKMMCSKTDFLYYSILFISGK